MLGNHWMRDSLASPAGAALAVAAPAGCPESCERIGPEGWPGGQTFSALLGNISLVHGERVFLDAHEGSWPDDALLNERTIGSLDRAWGGGR